MRVRNALKVKRKKLNLREIDTIAAIFEKNRIRGFPFCDYDDKQIIRDLESFINRNKDRKGYKKEVEHVMRILGKESSEFFKLVKKVCKKISSSEKDSPKTTPRYRSAMAAAKKAKRFPKIRHENPIEVIFDNCRVKGYPACKYDNRQIYWELLHFIETHRGKWGFKNHVKRAERLLLKYEKYKYGN